MKVKCKTLLGLIQSILSEVNNHSDYTDPVDSVFNELRVSVAQLRWVNEVSFLVLP